MKKFKIVSALVIAMVLVLAGCGNEKKNEKEIESVTREEQKENTGADVSSAKKEQGDDKNQKEEEQTPEAGTSFSLDEIKDEIMAEIGASDGLEFNANSIYALYGIDASDMKQSAGFSVMEGTFPHEVVMIEATDDDAAARIEKAFQSKIDVFAQQSKNYDAENYALAQKCKIEKNGRYYAMFLSPDYENIKAVYNKYIK